MRFGIIILLLFVFIACTDYVQQIDDRYGEWDSSLSSEKVESSSSSSSDTLLSSFLESSSSIDGSEYDSTTNTLKDLRDGRTYRTVVIGSRPWMAENLNFETESSYCYGDKESSCSKWGRLYTWAAAMDSAGIWSSDGEGCGYIKTCMPEGNVRGVCPQGWHLPNNDEWSNMLGTVGTNQGIVLKSTSGWNNNGNGTDAFGFTALPAGNRNLAGGYNYSGVSASFWSSTEYGSDGAWYMYLVYYHAAGFLYNLDKYYALSVRCLKDDASYVAECTPVSAHKVTLSNALQSSQSAINFETGLADNPHITIKFANEAATIIPGDGVTVYEDNSQTAGLEAEPKPGNTSICREDFRKSTIQYSEELPSGLWLDIVDASGNIYPMMVKKTVSESSTKGTVDIVYYK